LIEIVREFDSRLPEMEKLNIDQKVESLRSQIDIDLDQSLGSGRGAATFFRISYRGRNPETTQKIAATVTDLFIKKDNQARETKVDSVTSFVSDELQQIKQELDASNTKLKNLR